MHIMGALAEFERGLIVERTPAGIQAAKKRGRASNRGVPPLAAGVPCNLARRRQDLRLAAVDQGAERCSHLDLV